MQILIDIPNPPKKQDIIDIPLHFINGTVCEAGGYEFQVLPPHGRLIDIEKLKEEFTMKNNICKECDSFKKCDNKTYSKSEICEKFIWVPTILEAEKEE